MKIYTSDKQRRKDYFIKKSFQAKFILCYLFIMILSSLLMVYFLYRHLMAKLSFSMFMGHSTLENTWDIFRRPVLETTIAVVMVTIFMILLLTVIIAMFIDRRCRQLVNITSQIRMDEGKMPGIPVWPREFQDISMKILDINKHQLTRKQITASQMDMMKNAVDKALTDISDKKELQSHIDNLSDLEKKLKKTIAAGQDLQD